MKSKELNAWRDRIANAYVGEMFDGPVVMRLLFILPKPKSVKRLWPHVKPDLDKLCRALGDSLEGIAYVNDSQIVILAASKIYGDNPGVEIEISEVDDVTAGHALEPMPGLL